MATSERSPRAGAPVTFLDPVTWPRSAVWFALGIPVDASHGSRRSAPAARD